MRSLLQRSTGGLLALGRSTIYPLGTSADAWVPRLVPLRADPVGSARRTMPWILAGAAGLLLLTACLNVANLAIARGLGRGRDVALRSALGSGAGRIVAGVLAAAVAGRRRERP